MSRPKSATLRHELRVRLRLVEAAHDAEADADVALLHEAGDDGVQRPFARRQLVGVPGFQREQGAAVVQREAGARRHQAAPEALEDALDERHDVAVAIDGGQVDRCRRRRRWSARPDRSGSTCAAARARSIDAARRAARALSSSAATGAVSKRGSPTHRSMSAYASFLASIIACSVSALWKP